jgi:hypothetical protein
MSEAQPNHLRARGIQAKLTPKQCCLIAEFEEIQRPLEWIIGTSQTLEKTVADLAYQARVHPNTFPALELYRRGRAPGRVDG